VLASYAVVLLTDHKAMVPWPPPAYTWTEAGAALLGGSSPGMLAGGHGMCALATVFLQSTFDAPRPASVLCLVACVLMTLAGAAASSQCKHLDGPVRCPSWMLPLASQPQGAWEWSVAGCTMWTVVTAMSAWRQLGKLADWESTSIWRGSNFLCNSKREAPIANGYGVFGGNLGFGVLPMQAPQYTGLPARGDTPPRAMSFANAEANNLLSPTHQNPRAQSFAAGEAAVVAVPAPLLNIGGWRALAAR